MRSRFVVVSMWTVAVLASIPACNSVDFQQRGAELNESADRAQKELDRASDAVGGIDDDALREQKAKTLIELAKELHNARMIASMATIRENEDGLHTAERAIKHVHDTAAKIASG